MKIVKKGNPDKIKEIKETRFHKENPEIECKKCDAVFKISNTDVKSKDGIKYVDCPECQEERKLNGEEVPSNYLNAYQLLFGNYIVL